MNCQQYFECGVESGTFCAKQFLPHCSLVYSVVIESNGITFVNVFQITKLISKLRCISEV